MIKQEQNTEGEEIKGTIQVIEPWMVARSGMKVSLPSPDPLSINIQDIAEHLAKQCRFNGACKGFYTSAQHSILVANNVPEGYRLSGLLHEACKAYVGELISPIKYPFAQNFKSLEFAVQEQICKKYEIPFAQPSCVTEANLRALATERRDVMPKTDEEWPMLEGVEPFDQKIRPYKSWEKARDEFLKLFYDLTE